ncbi:MAG: hypothetical protein QG622_2087, partial [Actinomycetota bacterium]|nr:hypothetical protein [Actinomycetota bacterium]
MAGDSSAVDVLRLLADCESTGTLELSGPSNGTFRLLEGRLTAVVTDAVPDLATRLRRGATPVREEERAAVARSVVLDGTTVLLCNPLSGPPRFFTGQAEPPAPAGGPPLRLNVPELLREALARVTVLAQSPIGPDDVVTVRPVLGRRSVRLGPVAWQVLRGLSEPRSARSLAWLLGLGLVDTLLALADLVDQQACESPNAMRRNLPDLRPVTAPRPDRPPETRPAPPTASVPLLAAHRTPPAAVPALPRRVSGPGP